VIEVLGVTKRYGDRVAVDDLTFTVRPGVVTGFLGPNGAGKSTTMRIAVGLARPDAGEILIAGQPYAGHRAPLRAVGALLDARSAHPRRTARRHLAALAATNGIPGRRVEEVLELAGITAVADRRLGGFSLGMSQRLGIAAALLGDPATLLLDEPVNGLDPEGIRWMRELLRGLAAEGRTVLLSSHLMGEMALTADQLVVVGRGRLLADVATAELTASLEPGVRVRTPEPGKLRSLFGAQEVRADADGAMTVTGHAAEEVAQLAAAYQIPLYELTPRRASLEDAYLAMTEGDVEYAARTGTGRAAA
jgi:ABC-2 type transport system ATP-binding protein